MMYDGQMPVGVTQKTYGTGFKIKCDPEDQAENVMHLLITGHPLAGRSLDGVIVESLEDAGGCGVSVEEVLGYLE